MLPVSRRAAGVVFHVHEDQQDLADGLQGEKIHEAGQGLEQLRCEITYDIHEILSLVKKHSTGKLDQKLYK